VGSLNHLEKYLAVGDIDGGLAQFLIERWVVEQVQVLQQQ
jgi:hypothetical protein